MKKLLHRLTTIILAPFAFLIVAAIRLLSPVLLIRYGNLYSSRIGHFASNTELYLCERDLKKTNRNVYDILFHIGPISNRQLKKMWDRSLRVFKFSYLMCLVTRINRLFPGYRKYEIDLSRSRDTEGLSMRVGPHIYFTEKEEAFGREQLRKMGLEEDAPFVCFHLRDSAYLDFFRPDTDCRYHDYRDSSISNYIAAAEELCRRGYFVLRMGARVKEPLKLNNKKIIDYANKYRTDFLDIYLSAKCTFFLGCGSGIDEVPKLFRRPVAYVNRIPLEYTVTWNSDHVFIPKKLWLKREKRLLTFREILTSEIGRFLYSQQYEQSGIEVIENTPEEIAALVVEMDQRLKGEWRVSENDEELQKRFWALFKPTELNKIFLSHIGTEFLRQNKELLG